MASSVLSPGILYAWLIQRKKQRALLACAPSTPAATPATISSAAAPATPVATNPRPLGLHQPPRRGGVKAPAKLNPDRALAPTASLATRGDRTCRSMRRETSFPRSAWECRLRRSASQFPSQSGRAADAFPRRAWERGPNFPPLRRGDRTFPPLRRGGRGGRGGESNGACKPLENPSNPNLWCF